MNITDWLIIIGTIIGAFISGLIGFLTTRYDRRLVRKEYHLDKHKENLEVLKGSLIELKYDIYPYTRIGQKEDSFVTRNYSVNELFWKNYSIIDYFQVITDKNGSETYYSVNQKLLSDMEKHFKETFELLNEIKKDSREAGLKVNKLLSEIFKIIYDRIDHIPVLVREIANDQGLTVTIPNSGNERYYATAILNVVLDTDRAEWPNMSNFLETNKLMPGLKPISDSVKLNAKSKIKEMKDTVDSFVLKVNECIDQIDEILNGAKIKGNCKYF